MFLLISMTLLISFVHFANFPLLLLLITKISLILLDAVLVVAKLALLTVLAWAVIETRLGIPINIINIRVFIFFKTN